MMLPLICMLFLVPAAAACCYYLVLGCAALCLRRPAPAPNAAPVHRFAIVIPAHDEETILSEVLRSCRALDYPAERVQVYVIADNCTDGTARVARSAGCVCLERFNPEQRGKGAALEYGLGQVLRGQPDAVVILDADCVLEPRALRAFDARLQAGAAVLQANYVAANPDDSPTSYVAAVANLIENDLFYAPKSRLGMTVLLRGTGMVLRRDVLERFPWRENSIVEDTAYSVQLIDAGVRIDFVPEVRVVSAFPADRRQLQTQRNRWIGGNLRLGLAAALPLVCQGFQQRRIDLCDLAWTLLVAVRSAVLLQALLTLALSLVCVLGWPGPLSAALLTAATAIVLSHAGFFVVGALLLGLNRHRLGLCCAAPAQVARLLWIGLKSIAIGRTLTWERTPR